MKNVASTITRLSFSIKPTRLQACTSATAAILPPFSFEETPEIDQPPKSNRKSSSSLTEILNQTNVRAMANRCASWLQVCIETGSYSRGKIIHAHMIASGFRPRSHLVNRLIDIYCKAGNLEDAHQMFDEIPQPDVVAYTTLIAANSNSGNLKLARELFDQMPVRDTISWNAMISGYAQNDAGYPAVVLFREMAKQSFRQDNFTFTSVLSACGAISDEYLGKQIHCSSIKAGTELFASVGNALVSLYMKCGLPDSARQFFDRMATRDVFTWTTMITGYVKHADLESARQLFDEMTEKFDVAWNAMISGYAQHGFSVEAVEMFRRMYETGIKLDEFTFTSMLSTCANSGLFRQGKQVHGYLIRNETILESGFPLPVENALITLYSKCDRIDEARRVFDRMLERDLVSWNAIISGYINSCQVDEAHQLFENIPERSLLTWTVMISGFAQNGHGEEGLKLFNRMRHEGADPCDFAFAGAFTACASLGALQHGHQLHAQLIQFGFDSSVSASNALVTMYARCGAVDSAHRVFQTMHSLDSVSWNAMIAALGQHGHGREALNLFSQMLDVGIEPDRITFLTVLSACSHAGLVEEGCKYFEMMDRVYGIRADSNHYARLIDLLGRAGRIAEARDVIEAMAFEPDPPIWEALLAGCRIHGDMDLGILAAERLFELRPQHDGTYVLLSNMYASTGRWEDVAKVRKLMKDRGVKKEPGCSWIEVGSQVHVFLVDDTVHPDVKEVYDLLERLGVKMRKFGYVPDTKFVLHDVGLEQKEYVLSTHSEKLAVGFGILKLPLGATIRVLKNLRICGDCHNAIKFMSKVVAREIVVRDGKRFHHFIDGECSCGNYW